MNLDGYVSSNEILDKPFIVNEIIAAMKHLKAGKAAGDDNIKIDFILCDENNLKHVLTSLFNKIYETIFPIFKSGDKIDPGNYRGITREKLFIYILNERLTSWSNSESILSEAQFAYRTRFNTLDAIFELNSILSHALLSSRSHIAFIDFSKAFDASCI